MPATGDNTIASAQPAFNFRAMLSRPTNGARSFDPAMVTGNADTFTFLNPVTPTLTGIDAVDKRLTQLNNLQVLAEDSTARVGKAGAQGMVYGSLGGLMGGVLALGLLTVRSVKTGALIVGLFTGVGALIGALYNGLVEGRRRLGNFLGFLRPQGQ